jgi:tetratricopeptide (TPR) repeat protein
MSGIARAIDNIVQEAPRAISHLFPVLKDAVITVLIPIIVTIISLVTVIRIVQSLHRLLYPLNALQLHQEAIACLKKGDNKESRGKAKQFLISSMKTDSSYLPSRLTLAALQLYREENVEEAERIIQESLTLFPGNKDLGQMMLDVSAMKRDLKHMVLAGRIADSYLNEYGLRNRRR